MAEDLVQTPNGTFVTREIAEAHGLEALRKAARKPATRKPTRSKSAAGATRKGK